MLWRFFDRHEITFKLKTVHASEQHRADVLEQRRRPWFDGELDLDPTKLVFIDETGASTNLARMRPLSTRRRLHAAIPHGHYESVTTLVSALRLGGVAAPKVFDGR